MFAERKVTKTKLVTFQIKYGEDFNRDESEIEPYCSHENEFPII
jgi:hypothetical protein